ncbi:MAG: hypothetical protein AB1486_08435 [Planctomycetota bacterium]
MTVINSILTTLFDGILWPFRFLGPVWGLTLFSALAGGVLVYIWGKTSNQKRIKAVKEKLKGHLLEIRIYNEDLLLVTRAMGKLLKSVGFYQFLMFRPLAFVFVPVLLLLIQLNFRFGYAAPECGKPFAIKVTFDRGTPREALDLELKAPPEVVVETPSLRLARNEEGVPEVAWRAHLVQPGRYSLQFKTPSGLVLEKSFVADPHLDKISPRRATAGFLDQLLYPMEEPLPAESRITAIDIGYPAMPLPLLGFDWNWVVLFLVVTLIAGFSLKGVLKVEI